MSTLRDMTGIDCRYRAVVGAAIFLFSAAFGAGSAAAFECAGLSLPSNIVICSDPELMRLADERQATINEARGRIGETAWAALWENQKAWVRSYAAACGVPPDQPPPVPVTDAIKACFKRAALARIAFIRSYGAAPAPGPNQAALPVTVSDRIGPGFNCSNAAKPLAMMICADPELSRVDLLFNQAYWALLQQLPERERQRLKVEDVEFLNDVQEGCGIPHAGSLPAEIGHARNCAREMYLEQRTTWLSRITGAAHDEATRPLEEHIVLERKLRQLGFLATPPIPEGVYGPGMRQAILAWQSARGRPTSGFLSDPDAEALKREGMVASATPEPTKPAATEPLAPVAPAPSPKSEHAGTGTAFAINSAGEFLTNYHVVKGCSAVRLRVSGEWQAATTTASDERNDLAVVRVKTAAAVSPLHFRDGKGIRAADQVVVLGFPYAGLLTTNLQVTTGSISALSGIRDDTRYLQLTAPVQPGNSGGPLLDLSGNVVGVVSGRLNALRIAEVTGSLPENVNFAIKSGIVRGFLEANHIDYQTAQSTERLDAADVGETAMKSVLTIECQ
jgi:uncharacterized protein